MDKKSGSQNVLVIALAVLTLTFASLSGYLYIQSIDKGNNSSKDKDDKIAELSAKLRQPRYETSAKSITVTKVDAANKKVTILNSSDEKSGGEITLSVTDSSDVMKVVLSPDKKFKNLEDATLQDIKERSKVSVIYNGLDEVVYIAAE